MHFEETMCYFNSIIITIMKNSYRPLFIIVLLFISITLPAQDSPFSFIIKAGFNVSNTSLNIKDINELNQKQPKIGFNVGLMADYAFCKSFALQSGLSYTTKGAQLKGTTHWVPTGETHWEETTNMGYLQLPVLAIYRIHISDDFNVFAHAGPYFAYGVNGKITTKNRYYNLNLQDDKEKTDTFSDETYKRFDFGLLGGLGAELNRISISFDYELGLTGLIVEELKDFGIKDFKNRNASIAIGYRF